MYFSLQRVKVSVICYINTLYYVLSKFILNKFFFYSFNCVQHRSTLLETFFIPTSLGPVFLSYSLGPLFHSCFTKSPFLYTHFNRSLLYTYFTRTVLYELFTRALLYAHFTKALLCALFFPASPKVYLMPALLGRSVTRDFGPYVQYRYHIGCHHPTTPGHINPENITLCRHA